jgi:hypothetical protein
MNRFVAKTGLLGIVWGGSMSAIAGTSIAATDANDQAVLQANKALEAGLQKADRSEIDPLLDAELTWVLPDGVIQTKREVLGKLPQQVAVSGGDAQVTERIYGPVAVLQVHSGQAHVLRVWVRRAAGWRVLHIGEIRQPAKPDAGGPTIDTACINPCTVVPFRPESAAEEAVLASWQQMETGAYNHVGAEWGAHAGDEFLVVSSWSNRPMTKSDRVAAYDKLRENGVHANTVAPLVWAHMWDFGDTIFMLAEHTRYGGKPDIASRVWVNRDGHWLLAVSYHTIVKAMPTLMFQTTAPE